MAYQDLHWGDVATSSVYRQAYMYKIVPHHITCTVIHRIYVRGVTECWSQVKGLQFPGCHDPKYCRLVLHRSKLLMKPVSDNPYPHQFYMSLPKPVIRTPFISARCSPFICNRYPIVSLFYIFVSCSLVQNRCSFCSPGASLTYQFWFLSVSLVSSQLE